MSLSLTETIAQQAYDNMTHLLLEAGELRLNTEGETK